MVCVGIDVAKDKHDCCILASDGTVRADCFTIPNNMDGFKRPLAIVELDHPLHLSRCKGIDNRPGLTEALYLFGRIVPLLQIALIDQIVEPCAPHLEQVVDIAGRAARVLLLLHQVPDVAGTDVFQLSDLLQLQIFQQKTGRSLIIAQGAFSQMAAFTVIDKFIAEVFQTHKKKHPFLHGGPQKKG